jgi:uncharacterized protein
MYFVDTNVFLRYLTNDDQEKAQRCFALLQKANTREIELVTNEAVVTEIVYVLSSKKWYSLSRERIRELLYPLLRVRGLHLFNKSRYLRALDLYAQHTLDFEDCVIIAHMEEQHVHTRNRSRGVRQSGG